MTKREREVAREALAAWLAGYWCAPAGYFIGDGKSARVVEDALRELAGGDE